MFYKIEEHAILLEAKRTKSLCKGETYNYYHKYISLWATACAVKWQTVRLKLRKKYGFFFQLRWREYSFWKKWQMSCPVWFSKSLFFFIFNFILHKCQTHYCFITRSRESLKVVPFLLADIVWFRANTNFIFAKFKGETIQSFSGWFIRVERYCLKIFTFSVGRFARLAANLLFN